MSAKNPHTLAQEKVDKINDLAKLVGLDPLTLRHGSDDEINETLEWMAPVLAALEETMKIRELLPEEVWKRYEMMSFAQCHEIKLFNKASALFKKLHRRAKPYLLRVSKPRVKKETPTNG